MITAIHDVTRACGYIYRNLPAPEELRAKSSYSEGWGHRRESLFMAWGCGLSFDAGTACEHPGRKPGRQKKKKRKKKKEKENESEKGRRKEVGGVRVFPAILASQSSHIIWLPVEDKLGTSCVHAHM